MKQTLLSACAALALAFPAMAQEGNVMYLPIEEGSTLSFQYGIVNGISDSGKYAAVCDESNTLGYLWSWENPEVLVPLVKKPYLKTYAYDVNDKGRVAGAVYAGGQWRPAYNENGEWHPLDVPDNTLNEAYAFRITEDNKYIMGVVFVKDMDVETGGGYRPALWTLGDDGKYTYNVAAGIPKEFEGHQGYYPLCMTDDASMVGGYIMTPPIQSMIPAIWFPETDKWLYWDHVEVKMEEFFNPKTGVSMGFYPEYYIDGFHETNADNALTGGITCFNKAGTMAYGYRTQVTEVSEDGQSATLVRGAAYYDIDEDEWYYDTDNGLYTAECDGKLFTKGAGAQSYADVIVNGKQQTIEKYYGIKTQLTLSGVQATNANATVIGGAYEQLNPASGEMDYYPYIICPVGSGVDSVTDAAPAVTFSVIGGAVIAENGVVEVFDMQGASVGRGASVALLPGLYIVKAGNVAEKVLVK